MDDNRRQLPDDAISRYQQVIYCRREFNHVNCDAGNGLADRSQVVIEGAEWSIKH